MNGKDRISIRRTRTAALVAFLSLLCLQARGAAPAEETSAGVTLVWTVF